MEYIDKFFAKLWELITEAFLYLINLIPAPDFISTVTQGLNEISSYAAYPAYLAGFDVGIPMIASAYGIRFLIRRLPFIG